jgi:predicted metalloprotease with PDZ domain
MMPLRRIPALLLLAFVFGPLLAMAALAGEAPDYRIDYRVAFQPERGEALVEMRVVPGEGRPISFDFAMSGRRYHNVEGDGEVSRAEGRTLWSVPEAGGSLRWRYRIDRQRREAGFDARIAESWAILRGDQLVPAARVRSTPHARSEATLRFELPEGWSAVETAYPAGDEPFSFVVRNPERRFVRPTGWMIAGDLGIRREEIEGMELVVAAPRGEAFRRMDIVSLITATAPEMRNAFGSLPPKLLIVGAGDPMWRGGLSGPNSLYLHAARPMIAEDGTSTLLHELTHTLTRISGMKGHNWIAEGFAEFYSIQLLRRSGLMSEARFERTLDNLQRRGRGVKRLTAFRAVGDRRARAVILLHELDAEIRERSDGERSLDDLTRALMDDRRHSTADVRREAEKLLGGPSKVLENPLLR